MLPTIVAINTTRVDKTTEICIFPASFIPKQFVKSPATNIAAAMINLTLSPRPRAVHKYPAPVNASTGAPTTTAIKKNQPMSDLICGLND